MPKLVLKTQGPVIEESGQGIDLNGKGMISTITALTSNTTLTAGGMYTLSASAGKLTITLPPASNVPLSTFGFRTLSNINGHVLTSSEGASVLNVFTAASGTVLGGGATRGSFLTMSNEVGCSVVVMSDGKNFCVVGGSGSFTMGSGT